jgi:hypothetical protein
VRIHSIMSILNYGVLLELGKAVTLELAFHSKLIRLICESEDEARNQLGVAVAEILRHRLADMRAATSPKDLVVGRPRVEGISQMRVDLKDGVTIIFKANHPSNPVNDANELDWGKVTRIKIMQIESENASHPGV